MPKGSIGLRCIRPAEHRVMPWKNGLGTTREIAIDPPGADLAGRFRWRLSIAEVGSSGAFSSFPGYERTIMVIEGHGMDLKVGSDPARRIDGLFEPFVFSGDASAECRLLDGPIRDFNLMVDCSCLRSRTEIVRLESTSRPVVLAPAERIIHCFDGPLDLTLPKLGWSCRLEPNHTAVLGRDESRADDLQLSAGAGHQATAAVIELTSG